MTSRGPRGRATLPSVRLGWMLLAAPVAAGCAHASALVGRAAFDLRCDDVSVDEMGDVYVASGCARQAQYTCRTAKMESRCEAATPAPPAPADGDVPGGATARGAALNRAERDLSCPQDAITVVGFDSGGFGARGCGRRVSYVCAQRFWRSWCKADSPVQPD